MSDRPVTLVTGTSSGIGLATAVRLAGAGYAVVATMRDLARRDALDAARADLDVRPLDVQDPASIAACVAGVVADYGRIDVLVNNAGAGYLGALEQTPDDALTRTMDVNFTGVWRVTRAVLPHMRAARSGRIVTVSSVGGVLGQPFNDAYCAAKFAVEGMMESLAPVAQRFGIHVSLVEPGPVNTGFVEAVMGTTDPLPDALAADYGPMLASYLDGSAAVFETMGQTPDDVAGVILATVQAATPDVRVQTSDLSRGIVARAHVDPTGCAGVAAAGARLPDAA